MYKQPLRLRKNGVCVPSNNFFPNNCSERRYIRRQPIATAVVHCYSTTAVVHCYSTTAVVHCYSTTAVVHCYSTTAVVHCYSTTAVVHSYSATAVVHCYSTMFSRKSLIHRSTSQDKKPGTSVFCPQACECINCVHAILHISDHYSFIHRRTVSSELT
jgi:hypothetical protein